MFSDRVVPWVRTPSPAHTPTRAPVSISDRRPSRSAAAQWLSGVFGRVARGWHEPQRRLKVEERVMLGGRKSVVLLTCDGRRYLLASSGEALTPLLEVLPLAAPSSVSGDQTFTPADSVPVDSASRVLRQPEGKTGEGLQ